LVKRESLSALKTLSTRMGPYLTFTFTLGMDYGTSALGQQV